MVKQSARILASITALLVTMSTLSVVAQTFDEAVAAAERGDYATALAGFRRAAEQGDADAQFNLGVMYANGEGVHEDTVSAYAWLNIVAEQGQSSANEGKEFIARHMTQSQIAKAQKLSREYWTRYVIPFRQEVFGDELLVRRHWSLGPPRLRHVAHVRGKWCSRMDIPLGARVPVPRRGLPCRRPTSDNGRLSEVNCAREEPVDADPSTKTRPFRRSDSTRI